MEQRKVDIFGSFLEAPSGSAAATEAATPSAAAAAPPVQVETELLAMLSKGKAPVDLKDLVSGTSGSPTQVLTVLKDLEKFALVKRTEQPGGAPSFQLTDLGNDLTPAG